MKTMKPNRLRTPCVFVLFALFLVSATGSSFSADRHETRHHPIQVRKIEGNLHFPWGFDFLPDGDILVTEKRGRLVHLDIRNRVRRNLSGMPAVLDRGQGGLMDVWVDPDFEARRALYLTYSERVGTRGRTVLAKAILNGGRLENVEVLFEGTPPSSSGRHFGSRVRIDGQGLLYVSHGDRADREEAQNLANHYGTVARLTREGAVPSDNPFVGKKDALPQIFSYGHRNPQGMAIHPETGNVWISEHGARGGDEINVVEAGANYGWPVISYGRHYTGGKIGVGTRKKGMEQPLHYWDPSIAPAGMTFYSGDAFPAWKSDLFVASLKFGLISRLKLDGEKIVGEERLFASDYGRIRDVKETPAGTLMFITDSPNGGLYEILPVE